MKAANLKRRFDAVDHSRHLDVHEDHVGLVLGGRPQRFIAGGRGRYDLHVPETGERAFHAQAHDGVVVDDEDADHRPGIRRRSVVPMPGCDSISS